MHLTIKRAFSYKFTASLLAACLLANAAVAGDKTLKKGTLTFHPQKSLQIVFSQMIDPRITNGAASIAQAMERDGTRMFENDIAPLIDEALGPISHSIMGTRDKVNPANPVLRISARDWNVSESDKFEVKLTVWLHSDGFKQRVGYYNEKSPKSFKRTLPHGEREKGLLDVMQKAITQMLEDLEERIEPPPSV